MHVCFGNRKNEAVDAFLVEQMVVTDMFQFYCQLFTRQSFDRSAADKGCQG